MPAQLLLVAVVIIVAAAFFGSLHYVDRPIAGEGHPAPDGPLTAAQAHRVWRQHIACDTNECPARKVAITTLAIEGKLRPARWTR